MSIPRIYPDGTTQPTANGLGRLPDASKLDVTEQLNSSYELEMEYPVSGFNYDLISENRLIYVNGQFFQIYEISREIGGLITVYAEHVSYRLSHITVLPFTATGTPQELWTQMTAHAIVKVPFDFQSDIQGTGTLVIDKPRSVRDLLLANDKSFLSLFQGEFKWDNWSIGYNQRRGKDTSYAIRYGHNLTSVKQEENLRDVVTAVLPYASKHENNQTSFFYLPEKIIKTKHADSFSYTKVLPVDLTQKFDSKTEPTADALRQYANQYIADNKVGEIKVSLDVSFVDLAQTLEYTGTLSAVELHLGDRVSVFYPQLGIHATAEITKYVDQPLLDKFKTLHLGDFLGSLTNSVIQNDAKHRQDVNDINQKIDDVHDQTNQDLEKQKEETQRKFTEVDKKANEQEQRAQKAIREFEEKVDKDLTDTHKQISDFVNRNSQGSPLQFYDKNNQIVPGIPPVAYIKSQDGNFILNSSGFNWGGHLLGGNGKLYADGIYGSLIEGYTIQGAHIQGGDITGATIRGDVYINSVGGGGHAVMSGDNGFSFAGTHIGDQIISFNNGDNWSGDGLYTHGHVKASGAVTANGGLYIGGEQLTSSDISKLHRLKG